MSWSASQEYVPNTRDSAQGPGVHELIAAGSTDDSAVNGQVTHALKAESETSGAVEPAHIEEASATISNADQSDEPQPSNGQPSEQSSEHSSERVEHAERAMHGDQPREPSLQLPADSGVGTLSLLQAACATKFQLPIRKTERGGEHRKSCHMCGNVRKTITLCVNKECPQIFCRNCIAKALEQHGPGIFIKGCPFCKRVCCCGLSKSSPTCLNKYHCYRKCPVAKRGDLDQIELIANPEIVSAWHEPHCACSKTYINQNMHLVENAGAEIGAYSDGGNSPVEQNSPKLERSRRKRDVRGQAKSPRLTPNSLYAPTPNSDEELVHLSLGTSLEAQSQPSQVSSFASPYPSLVPPPQRTSLPANDYSSLFDPNNTTSFFDQCEEEFRSGLRKVNIDRIVGKYELAFLPNANVNGRR